MASSTPQGKARSGVILPLDNEWSEESGKGLANKGSGPASEYLWWDSELGARWVPSDSIGWGGGVLSTALWTTSSSAVGGVGNSLARSENG
jgi:hypothetical protein